MDAYLTLATLDGFCVANVRSGASGSAHIIIAGGWQMVSGLYEIAEPWLAFFGAMSILWAVVIIAVGLHKLDRTE